MTRQHAAQMVQSCFRSRICKCFERGDAQAVDAADVDDAGGRSRSAGGFEERGYGLGELEDAFEVEVEDAVPGGRGVCVVGLAPVAAAVVDEDIELCVGVSTSVRFPFAGVCELDTYCLPVSLAHRRLS